MKKIHFRLYSKLPMIDTIRRITELLACEYVGFHADQNSIKSTHVPFPILNIDKRMHTRKNCVGINPFIFISGIEIFLKEINTRKTQIDISVDQDRAILIYLFILCITLLVALTIPILWIGISLFLFIGIFTRFFVFNICIKRLIKSEILNKIGKKRIRVRP
jgi:hypothetical protein